MSDITANFNSRLSPPSVFSSACTPAEGTADTAITAASSNAAIFLIFPFILSTSLLNLLSKNEITISVKCKKELIRYVRKKVKILKNIAKADRRIRDSPLCYLIIYASFIGLTLTPGPIVEVRVTLFKYCPLTAAGLALMIASISVWKLSANCSSVKEALPIGT